MCEKCPSLTLIFPLNFRNLHRASTMRMKQARKAVDRRREGKQMVDKAILRFASCNNMFILTLSIKMLWSLCGRCADTVTVSLKW